MDRKAVLGTHAPGRDLLFPLVSSTHKEGVLSMSHMTQVIEGQASQIRAEQLAAAYQLGTLQQEYRVKFSRRNLWIGFLELAVALLFAVLAVVTSSRPEASDAVHIEMTMTVVFLLFALYIFCYPLFYRSWRVYLYSEGFAYARRRKLDAFRWDQIESLLQSVTRQYVNGIYMGTNHRYTIRGLDGRQVVLTDRIAHVESLGNVISDMVTRVKLPVVIAGFKAGGIVTFGPLSVSLQGVSNGKETISWDQVTDVKVNRGIVIVKKEGKWLSWSSVRVATIPNCFVFLALVNAVMSKATSITLSADML
jgi:hypothetical protein